MDKKMIINNILSIDEYISERTPSVSIDKNPRLAICGTGWYTFSANAKWVLLNYDNYEMVPYNQIAFTVRLLLEIASDYNYILSQNRNNRLNAFLKHYKTAVRKNGQDPFSDITKTTFMNDVMINKSDKKDKPDKTMLRVSKIFSDFGIGHYNLDSSCCHCNYCGMLVAANANGENGTSLRFSTIQIIPRAIEEMLKALSYVSEYSNILKDTSNNILAIKESFKIKGVQNA